MGKNYTIKIIKLTFSGEREENRMSELTFSGGKK